MKKTLYALLACGLMSSSLALADDPYLKLGVGRTQFDFGSGFGNESTTGFSIAYGAKYDKTWGLEAGYMYLGRSLGEDMSGNVVRVKGEALYLAGTGSMPLNPQAELFGKLGMTINRFTLPGDSMTRTRPMAGLGGLWHLNKEWGASLEYSYLGKIDGVSLSQFTLSGGYQF